MSVTRAFVLSVAACLTASAASGESIDVMPVWSGHPVGFALLTQGDQQFIAFYDAERQMTVGQRRLESHSWHFARLPEKLGWDSHNYVTLAIDREGYIHLSGNMHGVPLVYFRTKRVLDIDSFERIPQMVGGREQRCTYPVFFRGPADELIFTYRDGGSGNGDQLYNVYDCATRTWSRLIDGPLISGEGEMNAYIQGPTRGPDGLFHMCWVWRDTPDCSTNHDLSYMRSRDLRHWETSGGKPLQLPVTIRTAEIVDPVPAKGGLLNSNFRMAFDRKNRPVLSYHKYDAAGALQIYNARREAGGWRVVQASDWTWRWEFGGGGSIGTQVHVYPIEKTASGLRQRYDNARHGKGLWTIDENTLKPVVQAGSTPSNRRDRAATPAASQPSGELATTTNPAHMEPRSASDLGHGRDAGVSYRLEWQTLPPNRDRPWPGKTPKPTMLHLVVSQSATGS